MLENFPGYLGYGNIIAIHADWPMYPSGIGWEIALRTMGNFPRGTVFYEIDDIDRCKLLINVPPTQLKDPHHKSHYQIALWHEDLIELKKKGYVCGISEKSENEFEMLRFEAFKKELGKWLEEDEEGNIILYSKSDNGDLIPHKCKKPVLDPDEEGEREYRPCAYIQESISLTALGIDKLLDLSQHFEYTKELHDIADPLIQIHRFDTAIRDSSLLLETKIKAFHQVGSFGQDLINYHIRETIKRNDNFFSAALKCYQGELRTIFKYIRNDFAHNFKVLTIEQCRAILYRINETLREFEEVVAAYYK